MKISIISRLKKVNKISDNTATEKSQYNISVLIGNTLPASRGAAYKAFTPLTMYRCASAVTQRGADGIVYSIRTNDKADLKWLIIFGWQSC